MARSLLARGSCAFALAGHSMGGRIAFRVMQLAPDRVAGLALMDTAYTPRSAGEAGEQEKAERYALLNKARLKECAPWAFSGAEDGASGSTFG